MDEHNRDEGPRPRSHVAQFYDELYRPDGRLWWQEGDPYSGDPDAYPAALLTQLTLRLIEPLKGRGRVLDLGAGEGADAIRLALLGYDVTAVEISSVGAEKIKYFAEEAGARLKVETADIGDYRPEGLFDIIICAGVLPYVREKGPVLKAIQQGTRPGGLNVISVWTAFSPAPPEDTKVPIYLESEAGKDAVLIRAYEAWKKELLYFERDKPKKQQAGMAAQSRSYIKMIARKPG